MAKVFLILFFFLLYPHNEVPLLEEGKAATVRKQAPASGNLKVITYNIRLQIRSSKIIIAGDQRIRNVPIPGKIICCIAIVWTFSVNRTHSHRRTRTALTSRKL